MSIINLKEVKDYCEDALTHNLYLSEIGSTIHDPETVETWIKLYKNYLAANGRHDLIDN
jgi:hypothetical protein